MQLEISKILPIFTFFCTLFVLGGSAFAQQSSTRQIMLPPCPEEYKWSGALLLKDVDSRWHNCFGQADPHKEQMYLGEWKNGRPDGQGLQWRNKQFPGSYVLGRWRGYKLIEGPALVFSEDGTIVESVIVGTNNNITKINVYEVLESFDNRLTESFISARRKKGGYETSSNKDLLVLSLNGVDALRTITALDGKKRLLSPQLIARDGLNFCMVNSGNYLDTFDQSTSPNESVVRYAIQKIFAEL